MNKRYCMILLLAASFPSLTLAALKPAGARKVISLDGQWEIAQGSMDTIPKKFARRGPVPGLADMAKPAFEEVGVKSDKRQAFWYRRTFKLDTAASKVALLKVHKAKFGTRVFLNGKLIGDDSHCFTPGYFDVRKQLKPPGQENILIIRVGAFHDVLPKTVQYGHDGEKKLYLPGIYDSVELILAGTPYITNVQIVPDIKSGTARIVTDISNSENATEIKLEYKIREKKSGKVVAEGNVSKAELGTYKFASLDFRAAIKDFRLWSPEDPFLYELELTTAGDGIKETFGMRSFRFDTATGRAILNGKPYFMRGSNVCIFRFFGDSERKARPWDKTWVRKLHRKFKYMHWNSLRYCIGFPPEFWYDIADEEGFLIQDEFPIWCSPSKYTAKHLAEEFREWMKERWNHPCVVIWDAQNETLGEGKVTGAALMQVRGLDLSNRPWDNGWGPPQHSDDCQEAHPYFFIGLNKVPPAGPMSDRLIKNHFPPNGPSERLRRKYNNAVIINEYAWLWLNRDGSTTTLTDGVYKHGFPDADTAEKRRYHYTRWLAALTEYWRAHRRCAGVLHFCGLGYSRPNKPRGQTSDHFLDVGKLIYEPMFKKYVRDSFAPVGLMINYWNSKVTNGVNEKIQVYVINDLANAWKGDVQFRVERDGKVLRKKSVPCAIAGYGREILSFDTVIPKEKGKYKLVAELKGAGGETVTSFRDVEVF